MVYLINIMLSFCLFIFIVAFIVYIWEKKNKITILPIKFSCKNFLATYNFTCDLHDVAN